jgi:hypothetical protein
MKSTNDKHPAVTFLKSLYQYCDEGSINLRFLPSGENQFFPLEKINSIPAILEAHKGQNAYFGVATRVDGDGSKNGIIEIPALWVDLDVYKLTDKQKEESRQRYKEFPLKATSIIDSGGGCYLLWMLKEPASKDEIPRVENLLDRLAFYFHGDMAVTDSSRILRIPGSLNHKYPHTPLVAIKDFLPERQSSLDDFEILPQLEATSGKDDKPRLPEGWEKELLDGVSEGERNISITRLAGRYIGKGLSREEILPILMDANSKFKPPLPQREVEACLGSILKTHERNHSEEGAEEKCDSGHHFNLIWARDIVSTQETQREWIWEGILPSSGLSLVAAKPKVGNLSW